MFLSFFGFIPRWWHSKGFGVQSPFAYNLISSVILCHEPYYAYDKLQEIRSHTPYSRDANSPKLDKLLFRLSNFQQPASIFCPNSESGITQKYLAAGCTSATLYIYRDVAELSAMLNKETSVGLVYIDSLKEYEVLYSALKSKLSPQSLIIIKGIHLHKDISAFWKSCLADSQTVLAFDLYHLGLIFYDTHYIKQDYKLLL